jgi:hypothetical protein
LPSLPTQTAAHLRWTKTRTNLPPRIAHTGLKLAMRPGDPPLYVLLDAYKEVWTSKDGTDWSKVAQLPGWIGGLTDTTNQLLLFGDRFVALDQDWDIAGDDTDQPPCAGVATGHTWVSTDGRTWSGHTAPVGFRNGVVDGDRIIGVGGTTERFSGPFASSPTGETWTSISLAGDPWPAPNPSQACWWIDHLVGNQIDGFVVAARESRQSSSVCSGPTIKPPLPTPLGYASPVPVLWRSSDLASWTPVAELIMGCGSILNVAHGPRGFVALGSRAASLDDDSMRAWFSRDGIDWHEVPQPPADYPSNPGLDIAPDGTFLEFADQIWESTDGDHWFLSTPATNAWVDDFAGDLAIACGDEHCFSLRIDQ